MKNIFLNIVKLGGLLAIVSFLVISCSEDTIEEGGTGNLKGIVVVEGSNEPIENVRVSTSPVSNTVFTDENGEFDLGEIPTGDYSVEASKDEFLTSFEPATISSELTTTLVLELSEQTAGNRPPDAAILVTPADGAVDVELTTDLIWIGSDPDDDALTYAVTLRNSITDETQSFTSIQDTTLTVQGLSFNTRYFWEVTSSDDINDPVISEVSSFKTVLSPDNRVLFTRKDGNNNVIYSSNDEGSEESYLQLTSSSENSWRPRKNNEVNKIAFLKSVGAEVQIFTMDFDGSNETQITSSIPVAGFNLDEIDFTWDPDGQKLYYPNQDKLYVINNDGSGAEAIFQTTDGSLITEVAHALFEDRLVVKTNNLSGYDVSIFTIDLTGTVLQTILSGVPGAAGGVDISADGSSILYYYDVSGFENDQYRRLDAHIFIFSAGVATDLSIDDKPGGTIDIDPRFAPNDASVILTNTSNDEISQRNIISIQLGDNSGGRTDLIPNGFMPDWE